ncbi:MAG: sigma-70 family RNA polymerase sigma factor [Gemmatimonadaceae bacterium]
MSSTPPRTPPRATPPGPASGAPSDDGSCDSTIEILTRAQGGDRSAALVLIERAAPAVRRWARGRLPESARNDADTEDVVQDAVLRTLKGLQKFQHRTVGGLQAYLRTSVINRIRDLIRDTGRRGIAEEFRDHVEDSMPSPLEVAIMHENLDRFLDALQRLTPSDRQVIVWRVELGYSVDEIATRLRKSKAAAGMTVTRAVARLGKELSLDAHSG